LGIQVLPSWKVGASFPYGTVVVGGGTVVVGGGAVVVGAGGLVVVVGVEPVVVVVPGLVVLVGPGLVVVVEPGLVVLVVVVLGVRKGKKLSNTSLCRTWVFNVTVRTQVTDLPAALEDQPLVV
jgi:hypothetical protein